MVAGVHSSIYECTTVGSHLFKLQLHEHFGYLNVFSKTTPTISGYFH